MMPTTVELYMLLKREGSIGPHLNSGSPVKVCVFGTKSHMDIDTFCVFWMFRSGEGGAERWLAIGTASTLESPYPTRSGSWP
jgi:hypothetical protein